MARARRPRVGGISGLLGLLAEHGEAVEADLLRYYQRDLADVTTGRLSWRRLRVLLRYLPEDSATAREVRGTPYWSQADHLLAGVHDLLAGANWQRAVMTTPKGRPRPPVPKPHPRPGDVVRKPREVTAQQLRAWRARNAHRLKKRPSTEEGGCV